MGKIIEKIVLKNFKQFSDREIHFNEKHNLLVGDNEAGKSSVLLALDLVLSGSRNKFERIGFENLLNVSSVKKFLEGERKIDELPELIIDVYLNEQNNFELNGRNHSGEGDHDGLRLHCSPMDNHHEQILNILKDFENNFPFEFYSISFTTFSGEPYSGYKKYLKHILIDSTLVNNEYATREYVKSLYTVSSKETERYKLKNEYRQSKRNFEENSLKTINDELEKYKFGIRFGEKHSVEEDITIIDEGIPIDNKGKGRQSFIKTEFALSKHNEGELDIILLEEPENHLSHTNMQKLIDRICDTAGKQTFIATHSSLISSRLGLSFVLMMNGDVDPIRLKDLPPDTGDFFMKAPDSNMLEFLISEKILLVEGSAEYILTGAFFQKETKTELEKAGAHVISVNGLSFKRYLDIAKILNKKVAVIRDNDGNAEENCVNNYEEYVNKDIKIFFDSNNENSTFEICFYNTNKNICDELFSEGRRTLSVLDYMLSNKAEVALELLKKKAEEVEPPSYIKEAIQWING